MMALPLEESRHKKFCVNTKPAALPSFLHPRSVSWLGMSSVGKKTHQTTNKTKETQHSALVEIREEQSGLKHASPKETGKYLWVFSAASPLGSLSLITSAESCDQCTQEKGCPASDSWAPALAEGVEAQLAREEAACVTHTKAVMTASSSSFSLHGEGICKQNALQLKWKHSSKAQWMQTSKTCSDSDGDVSLNSSSNWCLQQLNVVSSLPLRALEKTPLLDLKRCYM